MRAVLLTLVLFVIFVLSCDLMLNYHYFGDEYMFGLFFGLASSLYTIFVASAKGDTYDTDISSR